MPNQISDERALKNAFASSRMEGYTITPEIERNCRKILAGQATIDACIRDMLLKRKEMGKQHGRI